MITIIKQGKTPIYRHTCPVCGAVFEFEDEDILIHYAIRIKEVQEVVSCPCCNGRSYIDTEECLVGYKGELNEP